MLLSPLGRGWVRGCFNAHTFSVAHALTSPMLRMGPLLSRYTGEDG